MTIETNPFETIHLRPHSFETTVIWDHFIWDHDHLRSLHLCSRHLWSVHEWLYKQQLPRSKNEIKRNSLTLRKLPFAENQLRKWALSKGPANAKNTSTYAHKMHYCLWEIRTDWIKHTKYFSRYQNDRRQNQTCKLTLSTKTRERTGIRRSLAKNVTVISVVM